MFRLIVFALLASVLPVTGQQSTSAVLEAMKTELARSQSKLKT